MSKQKSEARGGKKCGNERNSTREEIFSRQEGRKFKNIKSNQISSRKNFIETNKRKLNKLKWTKKQFLIRKKKKK